MENLVIIGSGPAGYTAALYAARADLAPVVVEGFMWGGLLQQTTDIENYPGFPEGILGPQLMQHFRDQAKRFGATLITDEATRITPGEDGVHTVAVGNIEYRTRAVILAMGAEPKKLEASGEETLAARGVSYCATCDAAFFRDQDTIVIGGGDTAAEDALFLAKFARTVTLVHRRNEFRASAIMFNRVCQTENIIVKTPYQVEAFQGETKLDSVHLRNLESNETEKIPVTGAFVAVGHTPNSGLVKGYLAADEDGYLQTDPGSTHTILPGIFAAGDIADRHYRQAVTAAGSGCQAALDAERFLRDTPFTSGEAAPAFHS